MKKPKNIEDIYELSPMQQGMLFHTLYTPESGVYVTQLTLRFTGPLNDRAFKEAWQQVVARHPVLRTFFVWEGRQKPLQIVRRNVSLPWIEHDWRGVPEQEQQLETLLMNDRKQGFSLQKAPLMRFYLIQIAEETFQFVWSSHHLLMDGWSLPLVIKEVWAFYSTQLTAAAGPLYLPSPRPYGDYIVWLQQQDLGQAETYWRQALLGFTAPTPLVVDRVRANDQKAYSEHHIYLSSKTSAALRKLARENRLTLNTVVQGAWALLLSRYSGAQDVLFGATVSGRPAELDRVETMVGLFINTLPVRVHVPADVPLLDWLSDLQEQQREREQYAYSPLTEIQGWSEVPRGNPLFESLLVYENYPVAKESGKPQDGLQITDGRSVEQTNYPLALIAALIEKEDGAQLYLAFSYDTSRFVYETIKRMAGHLQTLLEGMVAAAKNPLAANQPLARLPLLTEREKDKLLVEWNQCAASRGTVRETQADYPFDKCIHQLFEQQVTYTPEAIAVVFEDQALTYHELNTRANQLAHHLIAQGVGPDVLVGICVKRSVEMVVGLLGILKAGGAYVPLDPEYPQDRLTFMCQDAQVPLLLTQQTLDRGPEYQVSTINLDADWPSIAGQSSQNPNHRVTLNDLAYCIYTSGSTGKPKGVMNNHKGIYNRLLWMQEAYGLTSSDRILQKTPFSFDVSVWEFFWPLMFGATLVVARPEGHKDPQYLVDLIEQEQITTLHFVPSMLQAFLQAEGLERCHSLKRVICSGEALPYDLMQRFFKRINAELHNLYGPTEAAVDVSFWACTQNSERDVVPIGRPVANTQLYILDPYLQPVPIGVAGELHIGGVQVARGYLNRPQLNKEKFIPNPFRKDTESGSPLTSSGTVGEWESPTSLDRYGRLYKTGDLCRYLPDGNIEFLGRIDHQVKLRGFRIELGEIEAALNSHPAVREAVVMMVEQASDKRLVAYMVPDPDSAQPVLQLLRFEQEEKLAHHRQYQLSNGMTIFYQNQAETDFMVGEIFDEQSYLRHGITLEDGSCIFDVGANIGLFTLYANQQCHNAVVYAFEPIPSIFDLLQLNTALYGLNANLFEVGLASEAKQDTFTYYPHASILSGRFADTSEEQKVVSTFLMNEQPLEMSEELLNEMLAERLTSERITCEFKTLSDVIAENDVKRIDLLKIDVEKSELDILQGIQEKDWSIIKQLVIEVHDVGGRLQEVTTLLERHGFDYVVEQEKMLEGTALYNIYAIQRGFGLHSALNKAGDAPAAESTPKWNNKNWLIRDVQDELQKRLPDYMQPSAFVLLEAMPLTPNGKINRRALPAPEESDLLSSAGFIAPRDQSERQLVHIWQEVLGVHSVGVRDSFFDLGGHSLLAVRLMAQIRQHFGVNLPLATLFQSPTIEQLAARLAEPLSSIKKSDWSVLVPIQPKGDKLPFFCVPGGGGNVLYLYDLARLMGTQQPFYGLQAVGLDGETAPYTTVEDIAAHYINAIQSVQPQGPYLLGGHSFGGKVVFEMGQQLLKAGHEVARLIIFDTFAPNARIETEARSSLTSGAVEASENASWDAKWLASFAEEVGVWAGQETVLSYEALLPLDPEEQLIRLKEELERLNVLPKGSDLNQVRGWVQVSKINNQINYVPSSAISTPITLFQAEEGPLSHPETEQQEAQQYNRILKELGPTWGWNQFAKGPASVISVPGNHMSMMARPHIQVLAEQLKKCLNVGKISRNH